MEIFAKLEPSDRRQDDFKHPESDMQHKRWSLVFNVRNPYFEDEPEEGHNEFDPVPYTEATSYFKDDGFGDKKDQTPEEAIEDIKRTIRIALEVFSEGHDDFTTRNAIFANNIESVSLEMTAKFIKKFNPERTCFSLDDVDLVEDYRYILYGTGNLISLLREAAWSNDINGGDEPFTSDEDLFDWVGFEYASA